MKKIENFKIENFGKWESSISAKIIAQDTANRSNIQVTEDGTVYWCESLPSEGGRSTIMRLTSDGTFKDMVPAPLNVRSRVHEYGGAPYVVRARGTSHTIFFSNFSDGKIYQKTDDGEPSVLTHTIVDIRFTDMVIDEWCNRLICVCEKHYEDRAVEPKNYLATVHLETGIITDFWSGDDFYSSPRLNSRGDKLAFLSWNNPSMPWDSTNIYVLDLNQSGEPAGIHVVSHETGASFMEPKWSPFDTLFFVTDVRTGWWNISKWDEKRDTLVNCLNWHAEFTRPHWLFGMAHYDFTEEGDIVAAYTEDGKWNLCLMDYESVRDYNLPFTDFSDVHIFGGFAYFFGTTPTEPSTLVRLAIDTGEFERIGVPDEPLSVYKQTLISLPMCVTFDAKAKTVKAHGIFYPPMNHSYVAVSTERPPCIITVHGGPTSQVTAKFNPEVQFWTSRGFAVFVANYRGSSGYGRKYREELYGSWGYADVEDCVNGALYLANTGSIDRNRIIIRGGSAGGYTVLRALQGSDVFRAGGVHYGVSDLRLLADQTHKFEASYLDALVGPRFDEDLYEANSPINYPELLGCPTIFFQGTDDEVVPPNQSERMVKAIREKGVPVAYMLFKGEGHGFRERKNIVAALEAELYFYRRVLGLVEKSENAPVLIENENNIV